MKPGESPSAPRDDRVLGQLYTASFTLLSQHSRGVAQLAESAGWRRFDGKPRRSPTVGYAPTVAGGQLRAKLLGVPRIEAVKDQHGENPAARRQLHAGTDGFVSNASSRLRRARGAAHQRGDDLLRCHR